MSDLLAMLPVACDASRFENDQEELLAVARQALMSPVPEFERHADQISLHDYHDCYLDVFGNLRPMGGPRSAQTILASLDS